MRNLLLKQCYIAQDLDDIFTIPEMPQLERIFVQQKRRFYKRWYKWSRRSSRA